jgi:hypothetical protein
LNELAVILANNPDVQMGFLYFWFSVFCQDYFVQHVFLCYMILLCACCISQSFHWVKNSNPLEGAAVGFPNMKVLIEGVKVTKARKFSQYNKSGDMFTHL